VFGLLQLVNKRNTAFTGSDELVVHMAANAFKTMLDTCLLSEVGKVGERGVVGEGG